MHDTALIASDGVAKTYGEPGMIVVDIGGLSVNGSARKYFEDAGMKFICVDMDAHPSVDVVVKPGDDLPFETGSVDIVISTSCFEHDPLFWLTFLEMTRIAKKDTGIIYINAPSQGPYHKHPGDNWRFYQDSAQALAYWSGYKNNMYPVEVVETFNIKPLYDKWIDCVGIWRRTQKNNNSNNSSIILTPQQREQTKMHGKLYKFLTQACGIYCGYYDGVSSVV